MLFYCLYLLFFLSSPTGICIHFRRWWNFTILEQSICLTARTQVCLNGFNTIKLLIFFSNRYNLCIKHVTLKLQWFSLGVRFWFVLFVLFFCVCGFFEVAKCLSISGIQLLHGHLLLVLSLVSIAWGQFFSPG